MPFDAAHAIGNVALALVAGPAMVRMLIRFRERFEWGRVDREGSAGTAPTGLRSGGLAAVLLALLALAAFAPAPAQASDAGRAASWLESVQNPDGGFGASPGEGSSAAITGWAMLGLEAAGRNPLDVARFGRTPVNFLHSDIDAVSSSGDIARTILALEGAGVDPRSFAGRNLVSELLGRRRDNGSFEGWPGTTSFSAIALRAAGATGGLDRTLSWLARAQNDDGGWGDTPGGPSNSDVTGAAMQAIPDTRAADRGLDYLRKAQRPNGGFALGGAGAVNSQSTAWALQGMLAVGADAGSIRAGGKSAFDYLAARQDADGHYRYSASSDQAPVWVTGEALVAVAGEAFPVPPPPRRPSGGVTAPVPGAAGGKRSETGSGTVVSPPEALKEKAGKGGGASPQGGAPAKPPSASKGLPLPLEAEGAGGASEGESGSSASESPASTPAALGAGDDSSPSPWAPLGVALAATGLALVAPWWLGRRYGW